MVADILISPSGAMDFRLRMPSCGCNITTSVVFWKVKIENPDLIEGFRNPCNLAYKM